jgi:sortase A
MKKIIYFIPFVIIIIGLLIVFYPNIKEYYNDYKTGQIENNIKTGNFEPVELTVDNDDQNADNIIGNGKIEPAGTKIKVGTVGIITINKIKISYPILEGNVFSVMSVAVMHMNETTLPGKDGNCVLAAHRSFTYGRFFNRLDEVFIGDRVNIETKNGMYRYTIFEKKRVLPNDTSVLDSKKGKKYLTLITCDPMKNPTHRLILVGKL